VANLFMIFAPLEGWRHVEATDHHAATDYANILKAIADIYFRDAVPPEEARRLVERFESHYTPKHGSWLDMAESELGALATQCLDRRIPDKPTLASEVAAWEVDRNRRHTKADWQLTTKDARIKLKSLYPSF